MLINSSILAIKYCFATILEFWKRHKLFMPKKEMVQLIISPPKFLQFTERSAPLKPLHFSAPNTYKICGHLKRNLKDLNFSKSGIKRIGKRILKRKTVGNRNWAVLGRNQPNCGPTRLSTHVDSPPGPSPALLRARVSPTDGAHSSASHSN